MRLLAALLAVSPLALTAATPAPPTAAAQAASAFAAVSEGFLDGFRLSPVSATQLGDHRYDAQLDDLSAAGRAARLALAKRTLASLAAIDRAALSPDDRVDAALLENALRYQIWSAEVLQDWAWDTQLYSEVTGGALYGLAARDYAPWPQRLKAATARMNAMPATLAQVRAALDPARVPLIHAQTAAKQNSGLVQIAETMLAPHKGELSAADAAAFDKAVATLKAAAAEHQTWLDTVLVPQAKGDFRIGAKLYDQKMAFALQSTLDRPTLKARATKAAADTRAEMYAIAREMLKDAAYPATGATPAQQQAAIEAALEKIYAERPARTEVIADARKTLAQATDFVRAKNLVTVPDAPVQIITMPEFRQGVAVAYCDSPGPLERHLPTFYAVSPIPADWSDEQATSFLREYNDYMIHDLSIHEAMPGHYLQIAHSNQDKSTLRAVLGSGPFVEGWAVYAERLMAENGYMNGDPLFRLTVLKMRLRSITNTLLDIGIQTEGMTREQAMELMMKGAFQQEREAAGKWVRAQLSSTQLLSYFTGYLEHLDLRAEAERREGAGFQPKRYHDAVLSHGSPPAKYVRQLMWGQPAA